MKKFIVLFTMIIVTSQLANLSLTTHIESKELEVIERQGKIYYRQALKNDWKPCEPGDVLDVNDWIKINKNSNSKVKLSNGKSLYLPSKSIFEIKELKNYSQTEFLLLLTSLEISMLPVKKSKPSPPSGAYVIHGNIKSSPQAYDTTLVIDYLDYELNGFNTLYNNSMWTGVILKYNKLKAYEGLITDFEKILYRSMIAYNKLDLIARYEQTRKEFFQKYPNSIYRNKIIK